MNTQIHNLVQGSDLWHEFRLKHFGASEAAAMLGISQYKTREALLKEKATGLIKEVNQFTQAIFNRGHETEEMARPIVEEMIGDDLYPVTCSLGNLSASCDGLTLDRSIAFEHKMKNEALFQSVKTGILPEEYMPQCQQIMLVTGAKSVIFAVSDGTKAHFVSMEVYPSTEWIERIQQGWEQFVRDLAEYQPENIIEKPAAEAVMQLPALFLHAEGKITSSNMEAYGQALTESLAAARDIVYITDQDFSNASEFAKMYRDTCAKLKLAKEAMLSQTVSIGEAARMIDTWHEDLRVTALQIEKDVEKHKETKKLAIINEGKIAFSEFITELEKGIAPIRLIYTAPNFIEAIKGKRLFSAMYDAVQTTLANAKIECNKTVAGVSVNLNWLRQHEEYRFLYADLQNIVYKAAEDFQLVMGSRISDHKKREADQLEAERARIAEEERIKAEASAKREADRIEAERNKAIAEERARIDATALIEKQREHAAQTIQSSSTELEKQVSYSSVIYPAHISNVTAPTLRLGQIVDRLGFNLTAEFLKFLGFEAIKTGSANLYHENDFPRICTALIRHIQLIQAKQVA